MGLDSTEPMGLPPEGWDQVFERSPTGMLLVVDGRFTRANPAVCDLFGLEESQVVGASALDFAEAMMGSEVHARSARYLERNLPGALHMEGPMRRPDGDERWVSVDVTTVEDDGRLVAVATLSDLTALHRARTEVLGSERRWRALLTNISDTVSITDPTGRLRYVTGTHAQLLGYPTEFWSQQSPMDLVHPDDRARAEAAWEKVLNQPGLEVTEEVRIHHADGSWSDITVTGLNLLDDPDIEGLVVTTRNITSLRRAERLASSQAAVLELIARGESLTAVAEACVELVESNGVGGLSSVYLLEEDRLELRAGRAPAGVNDYLREPVRRPGRSLCDTGMATGAPALAPDFRSSDVSDELRGLVEAEGLAGGWSQPIISIGTAVPVGSLCTLYLEPHEPSDHERRVGDVVCSLMAIALEREESERQLAHQALHDGLTGLPNRTLLLDRLNHALARRVRSDTGIAVLFCDIDRFKVINDSLGHGVGDQILVAFAERFLAEVDPSDTVARFGGDEFVVLLEDVADEASAVELANRLRASLERPFVLDAGQEVYLTASIGLTMASDHHTGDAWLRDADAAMYRAKERGRNRLALFDSEMRDAAVARLQIETDLRRAVERGELVVHYQPVIDLHTGRIAGAEALARWEHPVRGLLTPADFIGVAEETGTILDVDRHVLEVAVEAMAGLPIRSDGPLFQLGVNVSARQLGLAGLAEHVRAICERHRWPTDQLLIEITEGTLHPGLDRPLETLADIRALGASLAIDDFGTGHSSLTRLGRFPVDRVKIDQSFIAGIDGDDPRQVQLVDAVGAIAVALDLRTTAEGVETDAQLDHLRRIRCECAQGYLFSKPLPFEEFADLLAADPRW